MTLHMFEHLVAYVRSVLNVYATVILVLFICFFILLITILAYMLVIFVLFYFCLIKKMLILKFKRTYLFLLHAKATQLKFFV